LSAGFEGGQMPLFRKLPQRGFSQARFRKPCSVVNLSELEKITGDVVDADSLKAAGLVRQNSKRIKLLGDGEISKPLTVNVDLISSSAKEKIEAAGGKVSG
jgi:large subunit ribosomal protein L15